MSKTHSVKLFFSFASADIWSTSAIDRSGLAAFLKAFSEAWSFIRTEESYPFGSSPKTPSMLVEAVEQQALEPSLAKAEIDRFRVRHDVATWFADPRGVPSLWLMREGNNLLIEAGGRPVEQWQFGDAIHTLLRLGETISAFLREWQDPTDAVASWVKRDAVDLQDLAHVSSGLPKKRFEMLAAQGVFATTTRKRLLRGMDTTMAATRMLGNQVDNLELARILHLIRGHPVNQTEQLDAFASQATEFARSLAEFPFYAQGRKLAEWVRQQLGLDVLGSRFDPETFLQFNGVPITLTETTRVIDAICFWGEDHGPAIILNVLGNSNGRLTNLGRLPGGARASLAHEICHLLIDRKASLPVAEVLGGSMPAGPEERARSFAAEVLLPQEFAKSVYQKSPDVESSLRRLTTTYGVSRTVASWQILKSAVNTSTWLAHEDSQLLRQIVRKNRSLSTPIIKSLHT